MKLLLERQPSDAQCTIGKLFVDGQFEAVTLEDVVREVAGQPVVDWKIPGQTAIPIGTYPIIIDFSSRFNRIMPHILNVPGFDGVRIHSGNTAADTAGCILVGTAQQGDTVINSRVAFDKLFMLLKAAANANERISIEIRNATWPAVPPPQSIEQVTA